MKNEEHGSSRDHERSASSPLEALRPFALVAEIDIGESEADEDTFRNANREYAKAPLLTVGDIRRAGGLYAALVAEEQVAVPKSREDQETITTLQAKIAGLEGEKDMIAKEREAWKRSCLEWKSLAIKNDARCEATEQALEGMRIPFSSLLSYARWTISDESPGHHPTMPSGVAAAQAAYNAAFPTRAALNPTPQGGKPDSEEG